MCQLTVIPEGIQPRMDYLENGTVFNNDGHGFSIIIGNELITRRGMDASRVLEQFEDIRQEHPDGPAIFHSRLGTDGLDSKSNCHPFWVDNRRQTVLAHNGIFPVRPSKEDPRSDTRLVIEDLLPRKREWALNTRKGRQRFARWMGSYNKVAILTVSPRYRGNLFILNQESGIWDDGIWYSNEGYLLRPGKVKYYGGGWLDDWDDGNGCTTWTYDSYVRGDCLYCFQLSTVNKTLHMCTHCFRCSDCGQPQEGCQCWPVILGGKAKDTTGMCGYDIDECKCNLDSCHDCGEEILDCKCI